MIWMECIKEIEITTQKTDSNQGLTQALKGDQKDLSNACAHCEDFDRFLYKKNGWCTSCEIFRTLKDVSDQLKNN